MTRKTRGRAVYPNVLEVALAAAEEAVLAAVEHDVLRVEVVEPALAKALAAIEPTCDDADNRHAGLRAELARLEAEVARLATAVATGGDLPSLLVALQDRERRRAKVRAELAGLERGRAAEAPSFDEARVLDELRARLADWRGLLRQEAPRARPALRALLAGRLVFTPRDGADGERYYEFSGPGTLGSVFAGIALPKAMVAPTGIEPVSSP